MGSCRICTGGAQGGHPNVHQCTSVKHLDTYVYQQLSAEVPELKGGMRTSHRNLNKVEEMPSFSIYLSLRVNKPVVKDGEF